MKASVWSGVTLLLLLGGCNGQVFHGPGHLDGEINQAPTDPTSTTKEKEAGIIFYPRVQMLKTTFETSLSKDKTTCDTKTSVDIVTIADTKHPQRLWYEAAPLEASKFAPTLSADGTLMSFNSESTPDQGNTFKNIASGIASLASVASPVHVAAPLARGGAGEKKPVPCAEGTDVTFKPITDINAIPPIHYRNGTQN